jgi:phosphoglycolate phosphatase
MFDLDGTLADTIGDLSRAVNSILAAHDFPEHSLPIFKKMVGNGFSTLMKRALPPSVADDKEMFRYLSTQAAEEYSNMALDTTKPYPGILAMLAALLERRIACAVLSNKPDEITKRMVSALFHETPFLAVIGDQASMPRKPDPAGALAIVALSGLSPSRWVFVGDSGVDMATGVASGMLPLGASWGYRSIEELSIHGAAGILEKPSDLLVYL